MKLALLLLALVLAAATVYATEPLSLVEAGTDAEMSQEALDQQSAMVADQLMAELDNTESALDGTAAEVTAELGLGATDMGNPMQYREALDLNTEIGVSHMDKDQAIVHKDNNVCTLNGRITMKSLAFDEPLAFLHSSCWPTGRRVFQVVSSRGVSNAMKTRLDIFPNGEVVCVTGCPTGLKPWISVSGITYSVNRDSKPLALSKHWRNYKRNYEYATVDKNNGRCFLSGMVKLSKAAESESKKKGGKAGVYAQVGRVHSACYPRATLSFNTNHGIRATRMEVSTDGFVTVQDHLGGTKNDRRWNWVSLNGISYHVKERKGDIHEGAAYSDPKDVAYNKSQFKTAGASLVYSLHEDNCQVSGSLAVVGKVAPKFFTLPARCRPTRTQYFMLANGSSNKAKTDSKIVVAKVDKNGDVTLKTGGNTSKWFSFDSIVFSVRKGWGAKGRRMPFLDLLPSRSKGIRYMGAETMGKVSGAALPKVVSGTYAFPNGLDFSERGASLTLPKSGDLNPKGYTAVAWFKVGNGFFSGKHVFLSAGAIEVVVDNGNLNVMASANVALKKKNNMFSMTSLKPGWHHMAVRFDMNTKVVHTYLDGMLYNVYENTMKELPKAFTTLGNDASRKNSFGTVMAGFRIFNKPLSQVRIGQQFAKESQDFSADVINSMNRIYKKPGVEGPRGLKGDKGKDGKDGKDGSSGPRGIQGPPGMTGSMGKTGKVIVGPMGPRGAKGEKGKDGRDGKDGTNGKDGKDGYVGRDGRNGKDGRNGAAGENGKPGIDGADGKDGKDGKDGLNGKDGKTGPMGPRGEKGEKGDLGPVGPTGPQGRPGVEGLRGPVGPTGPEGKTGPAGPQGSKGPRGYRGRTTTIEVSPTV